MCHRETAIYKRYPRLSWLHTHGLIDIVVRVLAQDDNLDIIKWAGVKRPACQTILARAAAMWKEIPG